MNKRKRGLRIGHYRVTPLGIGVFCGLFVIIAVSIALVMINSGSSTNDAQSTVLAADTAESAATTEPETTEETGSEETGSEETGSGETESGETGSEETESEAAATSEPTATPEPELRSATIRVLGEISIETNLLKAVYDSETETFDFSSMFSEISDVIGNADYTIADVEGSMGDLQGYSGTDDEMLTPSALLTALADAGVDMLMVANDHVMDGGFTEQQSSLRNIEAAGLDYVGGATSADATSGDDSDTQVIIDINGIQVGFVAYCESLNVKESSLSDEATEYGVNLISNSNAYTDIEELREAGAEVIIAIVNWGEEYSTSTTSSMQKIAQVLVEAGADVIIGYNPRVIQAATWLELTLEDGTTQRTLCLPSLGNFLSDNRTSGYDCGIIFQFTLQEQEDGTIAIESPEYIPTYVLRYEDSDGLYQYVTLAIGQWTDDDADSLPDYMAYSDLQYMGELWTAIQKLMGDEVATIARE